MNDSSNNTQAMQLPLSRLIMLMVGIGLAVVVLMARAVQLQVMDTEFLQNEGESRYLRDVPIPNVRGSILDRDGAPLAASTPVESAHADPGVLLRNSEYIPLLAGILEADVEVFERKLSQRSNRQFVWLRRRLLPEMADEIRELNAPGVSLRREYQRFYPTGAIAAHLIGYTNIDDVGLEGLELVYDDWLRGEPGLKRVLKDEHGRFVEDVELLKPERPGQSITLSIDRRLQYLAYRELQRAVEVHQATSASLVLLDVPTGEILAMVNQPAYNPNQISQRKGDAKLNRAMIDLFEPGSVMKPFTVAAALEVGIATPNTVIDVNPGGLTVAGHTITDTHYYGPLTLTRVITKSSNVGMSKLALQMEGSHIYNVLSRFGFGAVSGVAFPGESAGVLRDHERWHPLEQATLSYGHGLSVTTLQLAQAYAVLADGGRLREPTLIKGGGQPPSSMFDERIVKDIVAMLETVTGDEGTGKRAAIPMYRVAGKTGTAHKAGVGGYSDRYISSFVGLAPVSNPRLVCAVVVNDPQGGEYYGGLVAAPVFQAVMQDALRLLNVTPDAISNYRAESIESPPVILAGGAE